MTSLCLVPVLIAACYALVVTIFIAGRMDRRTRMRIRLPVLGLAFLAFLSITRALWGEWQLSLEDVSLAASVVGGALFLAISPRVQV